MSKKFARLISMFLVITFVVGQFSIMTVGAAAAYSTGPLTVDGYEYAVHTELPVTGVPVSGSWGSGTTNYHVNATTYRWYWNQWWGPTNWSTMNDFNGVTDYCLSVPPLTTTLLNATNARWIVFNFVSPPTAGEEIRFGYASGQNQNAPPSANIMTQVGDGVKTTFVFDTENATGRLTDNLRLWLYKPSGLLLNRAYFSNAKTLEVAPPPENPVRYPFPQAGKFEYAVNRIMPTNRTQGQMNADVAAQFNRILSRFIVEPNTSRSNNRNEFLMVLNHPTGTGSVGDDGVVVCEAQGFGMVMLAYMAGAEEMMVPSNPTNLNSPLVPLRDRLKSNLPANLQAAFGNDDVTIKDYFDAMFRTMKRFPATNQSAANGRYLMAWQIRGRSGPWTTQGISMSTATDGAMDMAYSLLVADRQWGGPAHGSTNTNGGAAVSSDSEYLYWAKGAIRQLWLTHVDRTTTNPNFHLYVGNWGGSASANRITRPSDFMLTHMKSFREVDDWNNWQRVLNSTYEAIRQTVALNPTTALLPDFLYLDRSPNPANIRWRPLGPSPTDGVNHWNENATNDRRYGWNACRVPWRIGLDVLHSGTGSPIHASTKIMNDDMNRRAGGSFSAIRGGELNGSFSSSFSGAGFSAPYLVTAAAYGPETWMRNGWDWARARSGNPDTYNDYIQVLSMIAASGNYWCPVLIP